MNNLSNLRLINCLIKAPFLALLLFLFACSASAQDSVHPLLFIGNNKIPPIIWEQNGKPAGLVVDLVYAATDRAHLNIKVEAMDWVEAQSMVLSGKAAALLQINPTPERKLLYDFSDTLLQSDFHIFRKNTRSDIQNLPSLFGKRVGVENGGFPLQYLQQYDQIKLFIVPSWKTGFEMLNSDQLDAVVVDRWVGEYELYLSKIQGITVVEPPIYTEYSRIAVKKGQGELLDSINLGLKKIEQDGTRQRILDKWKAKEVVYFTRESVQTALAVAAILFVALLIFITLRTLAHARTCRRINSELMDRTEALTHENEERKRVEAELKTLNEQLEQRILMRTAALAGSENRFKTLIHNLSSGVALIDEDGKFTIVNPAFLKSFGLAEETDIKNVNDRNWAEWEVYDENGKLLVIDDHPVRKAALTGKPVYNKLVSVRSPLTRKTIWMLITAEPLLKRDGRLEALICTYYDITEQKHAEEALREKDTYEKIIEATKAERQRFLDMLDTLPVIIDIIRKDYRIEWTNRAYREALGNNEGHLCFKSQFGRDDPCEECQAFVPLTTGRPHHWEWTLPNGRTFDIYNFPFVAPDGSPAILEMDIDITEQRQAQRALQEINVMLEQRVTKRTAELQAANDELEAFSYSVSHDLRAPLRHIYGFADLLQTRLRENPDEKILNYVDVINKSARKMSMLIDDLLAFSRIGRSEMRIGKVNLNAVISEVIQEVHMDTSGRDIQWDIDKLPDVYGDKSLLALVVENLILNAVKYTRKRSRAQIKIGYKYEGNDAVFFIKDNGVGFNMKNVDKLFGVFQRLHTEQEFEGTGIGLANVRRIISRHGGRTWAESVEDQGATFYFTLPRSIGNKLQNFELQDNV